MNLPKCPVCGSEARAVVAGLEIVDVRCSAEGCYLTNVHFPEEVWRKLCHCPAAPEPELLPCPFCGHAPPPEEPVEADESLRTYVRCSECGTHGPMTMRDCAKARERWNERKGPPVEFTGPHYGIPPKLAEALRRWRASLHAGDCCPPVTGLRAAIDAEPLLR